MKKTTTIVAVLRRLLGNRKQHVSSDVTVAIVLSLFFLGVVAIAHRLGDVDPEIVVIALVPVLIMLIVSGKLLLNEIQTPAGLKILFSRPLKDTNSLKVDVTHVDDAVVRADEFEGNGDPSAIKDRIFDTNTHVLSFETKRRDPHDEGVIEACMDAIVEDPEMTIRYLQFTEGGRFRGMVKLSDCLQNRIVLSAVSLDSVNWSDLANDVNSGAVLEYPGTITKPISAEFTAREALLEMRKYDRNWIPVVDEVDRLFGVVSEDQLLRDVILTWMDEESNGRTPSSEAARATAPAAEGTAV